MAKGIAVKNKPVVKAAPVKAAPKKALKAGDGVNNNAAFRFMWYVICLFLAFIFYREIPVDKAKSREKGMELTFSNYFNGLFQEFYESKLQAKPFMTDLKKVKNENEYKLFDKVNLEEAYAGKDQYIFGESMTKAFYGDDYDGEAAIKEEVRKAKYVQDKLKELGMPLLIILPPGKSAIYAEYLPDYVQETRKKPTNHDTYVSECSVQGVNIIDFTPIFKAFKDTSRYPTFSRFGTHWSYYMECFAIDTTIKRLEKLMNTPLPHIVYTDVQLKDTSLVRDGDIFRKTGMDIPKGNVMAYPQNIRYEAVPDAKTQKILAIGDSYFRGFFYLGAMTNAFDNSQQWYYYNSIIPENPDNPEVWELDLKQEIMKTHAVLICCNEMNLKNLGNGFIDDAYLLFSDSAKFYREKDQLKELNTYKKQIRNNKELLAQLSKFSQQKSIPLDTLIDEKARKMEAGKSK